MKEMEPDSHYLEGWENFGNINYEDPQLKKDICRHSMNWNQKKSTLLKYLTCSRCRSCSKQLFRITTPVLGPHPVLLQTMSLSSDVMVHGKRRDSDKRIGLHDISTRNSFEALSQLRKPRLWTLVGESWNTLTTVLSAADLLQTQLQKSVLSHPPFGREHLHPTEGSWRKWCTQTPQNHPFYLLYLLVVLFPHLPKSWGLAEFYL